MLVGTLQKAWASTPPSPGAADPLVAEPEVAVPLLVPLADPLCEPVPAPLPVLAPLPELVPVPPAVDPEELPVGLLLAQPATRARQIVERGASRETRRAMMTS